MTEVYLRIGQAAERLGVKVHQLRKLCQAGMVEAEKTDGGQWRIPTQEVERLAKQGVPPVPVGLEPERKESAAAGAHRAGSALLAPPSRAVIDADEEALISERELRTRQNKVERLKLHKEATQIGDFFRERRRQGADQEAARRQQEQEEHEERDREARQQQAEQERRAWRDGKIAYALQQKPSDAPDTVRLAILEQVQQCLQKLDPSQPDYITVPIIDAAVKQALAPWKASEEKREAVESALRCQAVSCDRAWSSRAREAVTEAIEKLRDDASASEMEATASAALAPVIRDYNHAQKCERIVSGLWSKLTNETFEERQDAQDAVRQALAELPPSASDRQIEQACETALQPIRERIAERQDSEMRDEVMNSLRSWTMWLTAPGISEKLKNAAAAELREAIEALPQGTPRTQLDQLRDRIVARYKKPQASSADVVRASALRVLASARALVPIPERALRGHGHNHEDREVFIERIGFFARINDDRSVRRHACGGGE